MELRNDYNCGGGGGDATSMMKVSCILSCICKTLSSSCKILS